MARTRKHADVRREEILRATVAQIESQGIHALRMSDVARALSVSPALIVYHFQTKETLIAEAFTWAAEQDLDRLEKLCAGLPTALDRLSTALEWYAPTGRAKGWRLWIEGWAAALREPELRQVGREVDLRWKESLIAIIQDGVHSGEFTTADPRGAAWRITALMDGLAVQTIVHRGIHDQEQSAAWARQFVARELAVDPAALARGSHEARKPSTRGLPSVRSAKSPLMAARPAVGGPPVRSVGVTGITALPAALADEDSVAAQYPAVGVMQPVLLADEVEDGADDQQPAAGVDLGAGLAGAVASAAVSAVNLTLLAMLQFEVGPILRAGIIRRAVPRAVPRARRASSYERNRA